MIVGQFMAILDSQIVAASLTKIQAGLGASAEEISWIQTSYLIAEVIMIPFSGFLCRWLSTRVVFVASAFGFTVASMWAGLATSMPELLMARAAQGFLGGAMTPIAFATAFTIFPPAVRDKTMVLMGLIVPLAPTLGPTLGGYITDVLNWRWLFYINLVPGIAIMLVVWRLGDIDRGDRSLGKGFDFIGLLAMALFLGCLEYALEEGPRNDWFDDKWVLRAAVVSAVAGVVFLWRMLSVPNPIIELRAFRNRNFAVGTTLQLFMGTALFGSTFLVPVFLAQVRQLDALDIGLIMGLGSIVMVPLAPVSGFFLSRVDHRVQIAFGALLAAAGMYWISHLTKDWDIWEMALPLMMRSAGMMFIFPAVSRLAMGDLSPQLMKSGSGLFNLMRQLGGAIGLAMLASLLADRTQFHWQRLSEHINLSRPQVQAMIEHMQERAGTLTGIDPEALAARRLAGTVLREATVMSFADGFLTMSLAFVGITVLLLLATVPRASGPAPGGR
jgi:DHA2 family multidrug resistance protein